MSDDRHILANERVNDDLDLVIVGDRPRYAFRSMGPVSAVPVRRELDGTDVLLGYIWFSDAENAAGFAANQALSPKSDNLGGIWVAELKKAASEGLRPSEAVDSFGHLPPGPAGWIVVDETTSFASTADVRAAVGFTA